MWNTILKGSLVLSVVLAAKQLYDQLWSDIAPNRFYDTAQVARFLGVDRKQVLKMVREKKLPALESDGNYKILGQSIIDLIKK